MCRLLLQPNGSLFVTTLNRSCFSWLGGIIAAEYMLRIVPPGTHDWNKFIEPAELKKMLNDSMFRVTKKKSNNHEISFVDDCTTRSIHGMAYNIFANYWHWTSNTSINYALHAVKMGSEVHENVQDK